MTSLMSRLTCMPEPPRCLTQVSWPQRGRSFAPPHETFAFYPLQDRRNLGVRLLHGVSSSFEQVTSGEERGRGGGREGGDKVESRQHLLLPQGTVHWVGEMKRTDMRTQTNGPSLVTEPGVQGWWWWWRDRSACHVMAVE